MSYSFVKAIRPWIRILTVLAGVVAVTVIHSFVGAVVLLIVVLGGLMVIVDRHSRKDGTAGMPVGRLDQAFYRKEHRS